MQPHKRQAKSKSKADAAARVIWKAKLWWLSGYPRGGTWTVLPDAGEREMETLSLDRQHLRRATLASKKLHGEFPRALPRLVGDADLWLESVQDVLSQLKPWVHRGTQPVLDLFEGESYPPAVRKQARALSEGQPQLSEMVAALSWWLRTRSREAPRYLRWMESHAATLGVMLGALESGAGMALGLRLAHLGVSLGDKPTRVLLEFVGQRDLYEYPPHGGDQYAAALNQALDLKRAAPRLLPRDLATPLPLPIQDLAAWLLTRDKKVQRRCLRLLECCDLLPHARAWVAWWQGATPFAEKLRGIHKDDGDRQERERRLVALRTRWERWERDMPARVAAGPLFSALRALASSEDFAGYDVALRALSAIQAEDASVLRAGFLIHWRNLAAELSRSERARMPWMIRHLADYLRRSGGDEPALEPWTPVLLTQARGLRSQYCVDDELLEEEIPRRHVPAFFEALAELRRRVPDSTPGRAALKLFEVVQAMEDPRVSAELMAILQENGLHERWHSGGCLRSALMCCQDEFDELPRVIHALDSLEDVRGLELPEDVDGMLKLLGGEASLLRALLLSSSRRLVVTLSQQLRALQALRWPFEWQEPEGQRAARWIEDYPAALHDALRSLRRATRDAESWARRIASSTIPDPVELERELRTLEQVVSAATGPKANHLEQRITSLRQRLESPARPRPQALRRLALKIQRKAGVLILEEAEAQATQALQAALERFLASPEAPAWLSTDATVRLLAPLSKLSANHRKLAQKLLRLRCGPPPWDLREHPANAGFVRDLERRGIDPQPWIEGIGTRRHAGSPALHLSLEDDPLEIFQMGRHFKTCLSPGDINYFSVFANAADINKRVLYGRDPAGRVIGRRLFCLTEKGEVLAFHPYSHEHGERFAKASTEFAHELAEAMKTRVAGRGKVPVLVARDWYDDGPVDIALQFACLREGSTLRSRLPEGSLQEIREHFAQDLEGVPFDETLAPMLLALPEFDARPVLSLAVLPFVRRLAHLPAESTLRMALLMERAGSAQEAAERFANPIENYVLRLHREDQWCDMDALGFLCRHRPSRGLSVLRQTRPRGVRSWRAETDAERLVSIALCMQGLKRERQAQDLYQLALSASGPRSAKTLARQRLKLMTKGRVRSAP